MKKIWNEMKAKKIRLRPRFGNVTKFTIYSERIIFACFDLVIAVKKLKSRSVSAMVMNNSSEIIIEISAADQERAKICLASHFFSAIPSSAPHHKPFALAFPTSIKYFRRENDLQ